MSLAYLQNLPGIDAAVESVENEFLFGPVATYVPMGVVLDSAAVDANSTPTTLLRRGLVLGKITSSGKYTAYSRSNTDGSQEPVGILFQTVNMYDARAGAVRDKSGLMIYQGHVKVDSVYGLDEYARRKLAHRIIWDDLRQPRGGFDAANVSANTTLVAADNGKHLIINGSGALQITLPAPAAGLAFRFTNNVDQTLTVLAGSGNMSGPGNSSAANIALSTASNKIGHSFEVVPNHAATKWIAIPLNGNLAAFTYS